MSRTLTLARLISTLGLFLLLAAALAIISLCVGSTTYRPWQLFGPEAALARDIVFELRLPRTLAALAVGGLLALAGALQQVLLRNPLADPYILGTSGGASVGALSAMLLGGGIVSINLSAGTGAMAVILTVFLLAGRSHSTARLLLTGVALAAFCGALTSLLLSIAPDGLLRGMVFWLLGDLSAARWPLAAGVLIALLVLIWPRARELNLLSLGVQPAHALGIHTHRLQWLLYFVSAAATAVAVTTAGMIGFVGLIVPHALRLLLGQDQRLLLPASALAGGAVLLAADIACRTVIAPQQLPIGVMMALFGVPVFLWLLRQRAQ